MPRETPGDPGLPCLSGAIKPNMTTFSQTLTATTLLLLTGNASRWLDLSTCDTIFFILFFCQSVSGSSATNYDLRVSDK